MDLINKNFFLFSSIDAIPGVGKKIGSYLRKKRLKK